MKEKVEIFLIKETRLDKSFPNNQLAVSGPTFIRQHKNKLGGGFAFYINDQSPSPIMKIENP